MAGKNTVVKQVGEKQIFPDIKNFLDSTVDFNQGDILIFDTSTYLVRAATSEGEGAYLLGIANATVVDGKPALPYSTANDAAIAATSIDGPLYGDTFKMILKTGSTLTPGQQVYADPGTSARGVASSGTKAIGVYQGAAVSSSAAGLEIEVLIGARYPNDTLKF